MGDRSQTVKDLVSRSKASDKARGRQVRPLLFSRLAAECATHVWFTRSGSYDYKVLPLPTSQEHYDPHSVTTSCLTSNSEWVTYDSPASALAKAEFINLNSLAGAMYWELSGDKPRDRGGIVGAVKDKLQQAGMDARQNWLDYKGSRWSNLREGMADE